MHHSLGEAPDGTVGAPGQPDLLEQLIGAGSGLSPAESREPSGESEVLLAREEFVERRVLRQVSDRASGLHRSGGKSGHESAALRRPHESEQHLDRRRLAGPVGPQQAEDLAFPDLDAELLHCFDLASPEADPEGLAQPLHANRDLHRAVP